MNEQKRNIQASDDPASTYRAYLIRLWRHSPAAPWRATVRPVQGTEQRQFADLESLCAYLHEQTNVDKD